MSVLCEGLGQGLFGKVLKSSHFFYYFNPSSKMMSLMIILILPCIVIWGASRGKAWALLLKIVSFAFLDIVEIDFNMRVPITSVLFMGGSWNINLKLSARLKWYFTKSMKNLMQNSPLITTARAKVQDLPTPLSLRTNIADIRETTFFHGCEDDPVDFAWWRNFSRW